MGRQSFAVLASALLYLASVVVATPVEKLQKRGYAVKSSHHTPRKWQKAGAAPPNHVLNLQIGLKQARIDDVLQHLNEGRLFVLLNFGVYTNGLEFPTLRILDMASISQQRRSTILSDHLTRH